MDELAEELADRAGPWAVERTMAAFGGLWPRWRQLTSTAAPRGVLCFGPDRGRKVTYTNPRRWLPGFRLAEGSAALQRRRLGDEVDLLGTVLESPVTLTVGTVTAGAHA